MRLKILTFLLFTTSFSQAQTGVLTGKVTSNGLPLSHANCAVASLQVGVASGEDGVFLLKNLPAGSHRVSISLLGYQEEQRIVSIEKNATVHLEVELNEIPFALNTVVVSGTRTDRRRLDSPVAVNVLHEGAFEVTQSNTLSEGLCFQPGLRMETDCQTCNYTQLRMNGLGGSYSQILIDNRPVFTSLMSLYGLEQIPASHVERVEVVRGGGSVLYGSNAIAGTVNVITKTPHENSFAVSSNAARIGGQAFDLFLNGYATVVQEEKKAGISVFASNRTRQSYDANGDAFSEIPKLKNNSFGFKLFFKPGTRHRLQMNGWSIHEFRRGGNAFHLPADRADQSEERVHDVFVGGLDYAFVPQPGKFWLNAFFAGQSTRRVHYTGIDQADGWGNTRSATLTGGIQLNRTLDFWKRENTLTLGFEHQYDDIFDEIAAYRYLIDQKVNLSGLFLQSDWELSAKITLLSGLRFNKHEFVDKIITTPRLAALFKLLKNTQLRASWARGFKAPQAFETDLHIAFAGGGVSLTGIDPGLKEETSSSFNLSIDYNLPREKYVYGFTLDFFHTCLINAFVLEENGLDENGNMRLLRKNGGNSTVKGMTLEGRFNYNRLVQLEAGFTWQSSSYDELVAWSAELPPSSAYLRTPDRYGFFTLGILPEKKLNGSVSGVYTGTMKVPHFGGAPGVEQDVLSQSPAFLEINLRLGYDLSWKTAGTGVELWTGVQNLFNAFQSDFDTGRYRDSNYVYGPARPRTVFLGLKVGME
jgi:outer membrane receptor for ferrienterochelin and colicins